VTTLLDIELACPVCCRTFSSQTVLPGNVSGRKRTDFHQQPVGVQPLPYLVHSCPTCGYSGSDDDFGTDARVDPATVANVWGELTPKVAVGPLTGSEKYELAAKVATWQRGEPLEIGDLLLRAAWCCVEEGDIEAERYFRRLAARKFEEALTTWGSIQEDRRAVVTYLIGELWRRVGDTKRAVQWFDRVPSEIVAPLAQRWVLKAALVQRDKPREWFDA
jgi:uncharacterized protein (DUF2225 family)